ncbi:Phospho-2-dehydro-3-deoxyheptonate aldolase [Propionispora sp. 2/2-37]|uniref:3-deoxy-7-phosphoheptulonate synthase n=1 Tax=Propionispora sp. 2/2-37 TaxID=1677858 RepID=UPI0006BB656F|nr:3-deoxy-7-phosphoheptulonate synthase [Propionispora sp. 2/2-37]CUH97277.1 Phospho-2-dehydro-3-deoxyheptonate aldolase [Propionispora sp. 2/2-37]
MAGYTLVAREHKQEDTIIRLGEVVIGGSAKVYMAGPCAVESREQLLTTAKLVRQGGAQMLRGGAFKPRTSPYDFQGLAEKGLEYMAEAREATGLKIVTEVMDISAVPVVAQYADILQIGARNMQNFALLKTVGRLDKPVLLKRGLSATLEEWLQAAEYILYEGNQQVIFCERGIRTFTTHTRNTLDMSVVPVIKQVSHLPVIIDPSHGTGRRDLVESMALAGLAAGADGILVEVHPNPEEALCDGPQSLNPKEYFSLMQKLRAMEDFLFRLARPRAVGE